MKTFVPIHMTLTHAYFDCGFHSRLKYNYPELLTRRFDHIEYHSEAYVQYYSRIEQSRGQYRKQFDEEKSDQENRFSGWTKERKTHHIGNIYT